GFDYAIEIARGTGAHVTVLHVVDPITGIWSPEMTPYMTEQFTHRLKSARIQLEQIVASSKPDGIDMDFELLEGKPYERIIDFTRTHDVDLVVVNLHTRTTTERAFIGSTAERVVRLAQVPVISVPLVVQQEHARDVA